MRAKSEVANRSNERAVIVLCVYEAHRAHVAFRALSEAETDNSEYLSQIVSLTTPKLSLSLHVTSRLLRIKLGARETMQYNFVRET